MNYSKFRICCNFKTIVSYCDTFSYYLKNFGIMSAACSRPLEEYFKITLDQLKSSKYGEVNIILGNESCDLDSAVSAITYAAFLFWQYNTIKCKVCTRGNRNEELFRDDIFVPVLNVNREDFGIKTEVVYCLKQYGIGEDSLVFRNDINIEDICQKSKLKIVLVDHHVLSKRDQHLAPYVTEIIDHRQLDKSNWKYKEDTRTSMEIVGSCATLVSQRIKDLSTLFAKEDTYFNLYKYCSDMLHSTIVLDTVNFSKELNKATPHDEEIILFLENILKFDNVEAERKQKLDRLVDARKDVSTLNAGQLLRKDVKIIGHVMVPSFPLLVKDFLTRPEALPAVTEALTKSSCSVALLLGMDLANGLKRDMAVYCVQGEEGEKLFNHLQSWQPSLDLHPDSIDQQPGLFYAIQNNLSASRKQYVPALNKYLSE